MYRQNVPTAPRPRRQRVRPTPATVAISMILVGAALTACEDSNATNTTARDATVATYAVGIDGMHCESCVKAITAKVAKVDGVRSCTVDLASESATVDAAPEAMPKVREAIARLGFTVRDPDSTPLPAEAVDLEAESNPVADDGTTDA